MTPSIAIKKTKRNHISETGSDGEWMELNNKTVTRSLNTLKEAMKGSFEKAATK